MAGNRTLRAHRLFAIGAWVVSISIIVVQVWVLLDPSTNSIRTVFPDWPCDPEYDGYLRALAWADVLFIQPLFLVTGIGLWRMRRWAYVAGVGVGCVGVYFNVLQIAVQLILGGDYSLYGMGVFGTPFDGTFLEPVAYWIGLLPFGVFPVALGIYCAVKLQAIIRE